ncbi:HupE/UreJ family protein [Legionella waltersii]|uniref:HupE / UreJ protein n=1 Tax=Legionella waltersii TaxID=66969 RepID=A0A0W1A1P3_9GAMM|nr:HupE/UreJ family protein [Legionella waltersii]KTD75301.1 HupE / UreJ protein [Legionella waltersii]SNV07019.1 HupE / UreJ protein [Legionella waltersii]
MPKSKNTSLMTFFITTLTVLIPSLACAHHAEFMQNEPFIQGLSMSIHGLDHLLFTIAVGIIAAQIGGKALWSIPLVFTIAILFAGLLNVSGLAIPLLEYGILGSLIVCAALLSLNTGLSLLLTLCLIAFFTVFQGSALMPIDGFVHNVPFFVAGCLVSALVVLSIGVGLGLVISRINSSLFRYVGVMLLVVAVVLGVYPELNVSIVDYLEA